jgi:aromatic-L-amino-acid decarboxylase
MRGLKLKAALPQEAEEISLDPQDWDQARRQAHRMLDDILDHIEDIRLEPVWRPMPQTVRAQFRDNLPKDPQPLSEIHKQFMEQVLPYGGGNLHPGFMGWVQGRGHGSRHACRNACWRAQR